MAAKRFILNIVSLLVIIGLVWYIFTTPKPTEPDYTIYQDSIKQFQNKIDSVLIEQDKLEIYVLTLKKKISTQKKEYEIEINRIRTLPADRQVKLFADLTNCQ